MSIPNTIRRLPRALGLCPSALKPSTPILCARPLSTSTSRPFHTNPTVPAIFGKGSAGEEAKREEEAARREVLEARERDRQEALAQATQLDGGFLDVENTPESQLVVPADYVVAPTAAEAEQMAYEPAESVEGLESVGELDDWWEKEGHWGPENHLSVFAAPRVQISDEVMTVLVRQAVSEALIVKTLGADGDMVKGWSRVSKDVAVKAATVVVEVKDGRLALTGEVEDVFAALNSSEGVSVEEEVFSQEEASELVKSFDSTWKEISLVDPALRFAISKRVYQLTGRLVSDSRLYSCQTVGHLLSFLLQPVKPKSVIEAVRSTKVLDALPNVKIYSRRVTPIDRRITNGSWKKIEEELRKRKLPIVGHEELGDYAERRWLNVKY